MTTYDLIGQTYATRRRADPRIAAVIHAALSDARSVINVGAGAGSYEPRDRLVQAVEPSATMIAQRPPSTAPCVQASAEALPFADKSFDAALAVLTIHHWTDQVAGLRELARVARRRIVLVTFDVEATTFWLMRDYAPALLDLDRAIMPTMATLQGVLGPAAIAPLLVPHDCIDGFLGAYWRRPAIYLDPAARSGMSSFARIDARSALTQLAHDLETGAWAARYADLLTQDASDVGYRLVVWELR